jgi:hypothetical protein
VDLVNPYDWPKEVDLVVDRVSLPAEGTIVIRLDDQLFDRWWVHEGRWSVGVEVVTATREITVTGSVSATVGGIPLDAHEAASASLAFDAPETGEFEVELQERIDGLTVGGLAYQWIVEDHVAPAVESHRPDAGAVEVALLEPIVVTFTEEIGPLTFNLVLTPALELGRVWWNQPGTVFTVPHAAFAAGTSYSASLTAGDAFANLLEASCTWSFRAREGWEVYLPLVLRTG